MGDGRGLVIKGSRVGLRLASDERLLASIRRGHAVAFEALYDRHAAGLLSFCLYMLGSRQDAEDAVQASFVSAYRALLADGRPITLRPWLFTIARNECLSVLRKRRPTVELNGEVAPTGDPVKRMELREQIERLLEDMRALPEHERTALVLAEVHGLSQLEIGAVLGVRAAQVKAYVFQARSNLISEQRAREADCREIREELADARGAALLRGRLRRHLRSCEGCRTFADGVAHQRRQLALLFPVAPVFALKYGALEQALGFAAADPATCAGGTAVSVSAAAAAAELANGGVKAIVAKLAVGALAVGTSAGVGVSVLEAPTSSQGERTPTAAVVASRSAASRVSPVSSIGSAGGRAATSRSETEGPGPHVGVPGGVSTVPSGRSDMSPRQESEGPAPATTTNPDGAPVQRPPDGAGHVPRQPGIGTLPPGKEEQRPKHDEASLKSEERRREREEDIRQHEESRLEREKRKSERKSHSSASEEGLEEHEPIGVSRSPKTPEERQRQREERQRKREERQRMREEREHEQTPPTPPG